MWLLHLLPDSSLALIINLVLWGGLAATVISCFVLKHILRLVPALAVYLPAIQIASVVLFLTGVYLEGSYTTEMTWRARVVELEKQVAVAEARSKEVNTVIEVQTVERTKVVKERGKNIIKYVDREIVKYDSMCPIPKEFVKAHNEATEAAPK